MCLWALAAREREFVYKFEKDVSLVHVDHALDRVQVVTITRCVGEDCADEDVRVPVRVTDNFATAHIFNVHAAHAA